MCGSAATRRHASSASRRFSAIASRKAAAPNSLTESQTRRPGNAARQLRAVLAGIVEIVGMRHRRQIGGRRLVGRPKRGPVAHEQRAGAVRQEHALVRIERQRVGAGQAVQHGSKVVAQREERSVGTVDVVPEALARAEVGDRVERIDRAGIGRAGVRDDRKRRQALAPIVARSRPAGASTRRR